MMNEELDARVDEIIQHGLSELNVPDYSKEFDKFDDQTRMMLACMFLINESLIGKEDKAVLREWLKETAMMA
jgi:hypothetical protein